MKRTVALKLDISSEQNGDLLETRQAFSDGCNAIVPFVVSNRCWNRVGLHHLCYYAVREEVPQLGSQMVCNALRKVCASYKVLQIKMNQDVPSVNFKKSGSVHYCARTFALKNGVLSLFSVTGRIKCRYRVGAHQQKYLEIGKIKEGELILRGGRWFFNLVLELPEIPLISVGKVFAVDLGENNIATTSKGTIYGGGKLKDKRDRFLARRKKLQSNGSRSAHRRLKKISGRENRHVRETNHIVSKAIIAEAVECETKTIVLENLINIRKRIKGNKRMRSRLHRWSWRQLQTFLAYKARAKGIDVQYVNPAYTSQTCSICGALGTRKKHLFKCPNCGSYQHSDRNACQNLCKLAGSVVPTTVCVNMPMVAMALPLVTSFRL